MNTQQNCWWTLSLYQQWSLASCDTRDTTLQAILTGSTCLPHEVIQVCKTNFVSANCTYSNPLFQMILAHHHPPPYQVWLQKISSGQSGTDGHGNSRIFIKFKQSWERVESWLQHEQSNGWKFAAPPPPPPMHCWCEFQLQGQNEGTQEESESTQREWQNHRLPLQNEESHSDRKRRDTDHTGLEFLWQWVHQLISVGSLWVRWLLLACQVFDQHPENNMQQVWFEWTRKRAAHFSPTGHLMWDFHHSLSLCVI